MEFTLPQPPPNAPRPPRGLTRRLLMPGVWILVLVVLGATCLAAIISALNKQVMLAAWSNAGRIGAELTSFESIYGRFPDASTAPAVLAKTSTPLSLGSTSANQLFRQLLVTMPIPGEEVFWIKTRISPKRPDEIFSSDATALHAGECAFAYVAGLSSASPPDAPVLVFPLVPGKLTFNPALFSGQAVILHVDKSVVTYPIDSAGRVMIGGKDLFDPLQPFWKGKAPDVKWQE